MKSGTVAKNHKRSEELYMQSYIYTNIHTQTKYRYVAYTSQS